MEETVKPLCIYGIMKHDRSLGYARYEALKRIKLIVKQRRHFERSNVVFHCEAEKSIMPHYAK